jgi:ornithine cyclodeaminase/alanine dehydrogenase-like protein (mu-crystallin family)
MSTFRVLTEQQAQACIDLPGAYRAVESAYRDFGRSSEIQSRPPVLRIPGPRPTLGRAELGQYRIKGASVPTCKVAGAFLATRDYPYMFLWDSDTDQPIGLIACDWLTQYRVAITVAVAIRTLGATVVRKIAFFGAGKYAFEPCRLLAQQWPDAQISIVATSRASAEKLASRMPRSVLAGNDPRAAVADAEVVVTLTNTQSPFFPSGWLKPGALLISMGSAHELEVAALQDVDAVIVDDLEYALMQGNLAAWMRRGEITQAKLQERLRGNIGEVLAGLKAGRTGSNERILAVIQGLTACDVAMARVALERATADNIGQTVNL